MHFDPVYVALRVLWAMFVVFAVLGVWKFGEIVIWLFQNVSVNVGG